YLAGGTAMQFQLRTDNHINNSEGLATWVQAEVEGTLAHRFGERLRRVEVYLQDVNSHKGGVDTRCAIEAHLSGLPAIAVNEQAVDINQAVSGALDKLLRTLEHRLGRLQDRHGHTSASGEPT